VAGLICDDTCKTSCPLSTRHSVHWPWLLLPLMLMLNQHLILLLMLMRVEIKSYM
jgi:hypothetical protein